MHIVNLFFQNVYVILMSLKLYVIVDQRKSGILDIYDGIQSLAVSKNINVLHLAPPPPLGTLFVLKE